jgi:FKBP-type peptidyl-prolyl cis-trans isomerase FkpA
MTSRLSAIAFGLSLCFAVLPSAATAQAPQELVKTDTVVGKGRLAMTGSMVTIHYTGWIYAPKSPKQRGGKFDTSLDGEPYTFKLGAGSVIKGWDEGLRGMKAGGKRTLIVPASLGFGRDGLGPVPPTANLIFDIELVDVK